MISIKEYNTFVDEKRFVIGDFGKWVRFDESYPPLNAKNALEGTTIEVLCHHGDPTFHCVYCIEGEVRFRDHDFSTELLEWRMPDCLDLYWRFVPDPPCNERYNCG